jgi:uncharacterized protein (TIGR03067 family)
MRRLLLAVLLIALLLGSDSQQEFDHTTSGPLEGMWRLIYVEIKGFTVDLSSSETVLTLSSRTFTQKFGDGDLRRGSYRIDPARKPSYLDWMPSNEEMLPMIYQIDGDRLTMAYKNSERPRDFKGDELVIVIAYKRVR